MSNTIDDTTTSDHQTDHQRKRNQRGTIVLDDTVEIERAPDDVFAYVVDVANDPEWQDGLQEARFTSPGPIGVGTTGVHIARPFGLTVEVGWQLTEHEPGRRVAWTFISGPFTGHESYSVEPAPSGTQLSHRAELRPHGLLRLLRPIVGPAFVRQSDEALQCVKQILESAAAPVEADSTDGTSH